MPDSQPVSNAIATLALRKFLEASAGEAAKQLTPSALTGLNTLRQRVWGRLRGIPSPEELKATIEHDGVAPEQKLEQVISRLTEAMKADPAFAEEIMQLATNLNQEIDASQIRGRNIQTAAGGSSTTQINNSAAPVFAGPVSGGNINFHYYQGPPLAQPSPANSSAPTTAAQRLALFQKLASLPSPQFEQVLFALNPPPGNVPSAQAPQGDRVKALLDWSTSIGPGLGEVEVVYDYVINPC